MPTTTTIEDDPVRIPPRPSRRKQSADARAFNAALWRLRTDRCRNVAEIDEQLAVLTGLTPAAVRGRARRAEFDLRPDDAPPALDAETRLYLQNHYGKADDPAVRDWLASRGVQIRSRP